MVALRLRHFSALWQQRSRYIFCLTRLSLSQPFYCPSTHIAGLNSWLQFRKRWFEWGIWAAWTNSSRHLCSAYKTNEPSSADYVETTAIVVWDCRSWKATALHHGILASYGIQSRAYHRCVTISTKNGKYQRISSVIAKFVDDFLIEGTAKALEAFFTALSQRFEL